MSNNDQMMNYPGEERYYGQKQQVPNSQPLPVSGSYTMPGASYPELPVTNSTPPPPPETIYPTPPSLTTQDFGRNLPGGKIDDHNRPPKPNVWKIATLVLLIMVVALASATAVLIINRPSPNSPPIVVNPTPQPTSGLATTPTGASTPSSTPTVKPSSADNYSAQQPGPGCDKNAGTWTPQGLSNITCGTQISLSSPPTRGYLFLQLPNNRAFSPNNKIGVIGSPSSGGRAGNTVCVGLDEQDANTGFLAEYCDSGKWSIYTISATDGSIVQTLDTNITSTRTTAAISLALQGTTLTFSIDNEVHTVNNITPIQPIKVAITDSNGCSGCYSGIPVNNFTYTVLSS